MLVALTCLVLSSLYVNISVYLLFFLSPLSVSFLSLYLFSSAVPFSLLSLRHVSNAAGLRWSCMPVSRGGISCRLIHFLYSLIHFLLSDSAVLSYVFFFTKTTCNLQSVMILGGLYIYILIVIVVYAFFELKKKLIIISKYVLFWFW